MVNSAPMSVHSSGQLIATGAPTEIKGVASNVAGGLLNAAAAKTASSIAEQAAHAKAAGATMKGGGTVINVPPAAEGGSVPGVSFKANHAALISAANQLKAGAVYDGLIGTQPYKVGGRRHRGPTLKTHRRRTPLGYIVNPEEEPVIIAGRKHRRKTKHGRSNKSRTHRRSRVKHLRRSRRSSRRNRKR